MLRNIFTRSSKESDIQNFYQKLKEVQEVSVSDNREALVCTSLRHIFKLEYQRNYYPATGCPKIKLALGKSSIKKKTEKSDIVHIWVLTHPTLPISDIEFNDIYF